MPDTIQISRTTALAALAAVNAVAVEARRLANTPCDPWMKRVHGERADKAEAAPMRSKPRFPRETTTPCAR